MNLPWFEYGSFHCQIQGHQDVTANFAANSIQPRPTGKITQGDFSSGKDFLYVLQASASIVMINVSHFH